MQKIGETKLALWMVCVNRAGYREGAQLVEFCDDWRACVKANGGPLPNVDHYAMWTRTFSYRTAYRRLALFRKTFPQLGPAGTPEGILGPLLEQLAAEVTTEEDSDE
jgi:hypothetical protein